MKYYYGGNLTFVQTTEYITPRVNANINYEHRVTMIGQYRFINYNEYSIPMNGVYNKGGCAYVGHGVYGKPLYILSNFPMNLKLL